RATDLVRELQTRIKRIVDGAVDLQKPTVACIEWIEPLMAAGNWMPEIIEMAGGINLFGAAGKHSPWLLWEDVVSKDPGV
ncbi:cobalamin-binding protein, partial [Acinetobacter baumannii]